MSTRRRLTVSGAALAVALSGALPVALPGLATAQPSQAPQATTSPALAAKAEGSTTDPDLDVLFVGAHPDDEAFGLATYGQWNEYDDIQSGVITITRGEGGGNAVGPEEGPALGLIREAEERRAVGRAGITDIYNLDKVDFYYTVSAPLTEQAWGHDDTLSRVVRVIRETRPEVITTMDTAPSPGNHGNHQYAGRMAFEAYRLAGDTNAFPGQITDEGLEPWAPSKLITSGARGSSAGPGPDCPTGFTPTRPAQNIYGIWQGRHSDRWDDTWAQVAREGQREYASQGWAVFPDVPDDPNQLGCNYWTQIEARVPFTRGDLTEAAADPTTMLQGAILPTPDGLPLGTGLVVKPEPFDVTPGGSTTVSVDLTAPAKKALQRVSLDVTAPDGWTVDGDGDIGKVKAGRTVTREFTVTAAPDAATNNRVLVSADVTAKGGAGHGDTELSVVPAVRGDQEPLPQVADFESWVDANAYPQMEGFVKPVLTLPSGGSRTVDVTLTNFSDETQSGDVTLQLPDGFSSDPATATYADLGAGEQTDVTFTVTNTDASLPTSNQGGDGGDYDYTIVTTAGATTSETHPALELVPTTAVDEAAAAPTVDGVVSDGEYAGDPLDLSRVWEGDDCESAADCSAIGHLTRYGDDFYVAVEVTDDTLGTVLDASDCKRHWRTDSVELAFDPTGDSENTSTTFKLLALPTTTEGEVCYGRDADNDQGPGAETAPDLDVASTLSDPYAGYVIEAKIPASSLPSTVDPDHLGFNAFVYDSDTQDKTGQTRIGWSVWQGVQGDPYRWGIVELPAWTPPDVPTSEPVIPSESLASADSPQTIAQSVRNGVALGGGPAADPDSSATLSSATAGSGQVTATLSVTGPGTAHLFVVSDGDVLGSVREEVTDTGPVDVNIPVSGSTDGARVLLAYVADSGGTTSTAGPVQ
ncbi:MAG TPA: sugar-binding protein [Nocardioidaceae bacterium]|nr:sugar-binding protein [Nocardioidaceae bacterium]